MDELAMYIFVNIDLKMDKGKICSQVGHVVQLVTEEIIRKSYESKKLLDCCARYTDWNNNGSAKIVLKATETKLLELKECDESRYIYDAGKTQIKSGSLTVVAFYPNYKKRMDFVKEYKLL